jgi:hypothetical protein
MISVRLGGVVLREVPCNKKEVESLRDGPFSDFRPSSNAFLEKDTSGKSPLKGEEKVALSETDAEVLESQKAQAKQASVATGPRVDGPPVTGKGEEDEVEDDFSDTHPKADDNPGEAEEELEPTLEADDTAQPPRWDSEILCVTDPFIREKVKLVVIEGMTHPSLYLSD